MKTKEILGILMLFLCTFCFINPSLRASLATTTAPSPAGTSKQSSCAAMQLP